MFAPSHLLFYLTDVADDMNNMLLRLELALVFLEEERVMQQ